MREGPKKPLRKRPLNGNASRVGRALPGCAVLFAVDRLISMEDARTKIPRSGGTPGSAYLAVGGDLCVRMNAFHILTMMTQMTENLLMCPFFLTSTFVPVFVYISTPSASCAIWPVLQYQRM